MLNAFSLHCVLVNIFQLWPNIKITLVKFLKIDHAVFRIFIFNHDRVIKNIFKMLFLDETSILRYGHFHN